MNIAFSKAYAALGEDSYREMAIANMRFLRKHLRGRSPNDGQSHPLGGENGVSTLVSCLERDGQPYRVSWTIMPV